MTDIKNMKQRADDSGYFVSDYIKREDAVEALNRHKKTFSYGENNSKERYAYMQHLADFKAIEEIPTADVRENVKGEWTKEEGYVAGDREWKCSICGAIFWNGSMKRYHFCPNCGAQMER